LQAALAEFSVFVATRVSVRAVVVRHLVDGVRRARRFSKGWCDMAKFMYLYRGPATPMSGLTPEQGAERMAAFGAWMERVGSALVDVGSPFGASGSVRDDGAEGAAGGLIGYSIVEADDLAAAKGFTDGLPFLSHHDGTCTVEIFELLSM
jgi:hypothetical protein